MHINKKNLQRISYFSIIVASTIILYSSFKMRTHFLGNSTSPKTDAGATEIIKLLNTRGFKQEIWNFDLHPEQWIYEGSSPCIINFYAESEKYSDSLHVFMEELARENGEKIKYYRVDANKELKLRNFLTIKKVPVSMFIPTNAKPMLQTGLMPKSWYRSFIQEKLLSASATNDNTN